jgi:hypothetical protein
MTGYRRLPGFRRGFINSSSVWLGADHLLLVKSTRFREEYKRFHLSDIQAIAIARAPRFHISTRAVAIAAAWLVSVWASALLFPAVAKVSTSTSSSGDSITTTTTTMTSFGVAPVFWWIAAGLAAAWLYISAARSCRCRIYTAVSSDELPSVYRTWTARKLLAAVEPRIAAAQGVVEGEWAEAAESREIGPAQPPGPSTANPASPLRAPSRTLASDLLIAVLFASGLLELLTLNSAPSAGRGPAIGLMFAKVVLAFVIFVQHYKGKLQSGMQKVAIATLLAMGVMFYAEQMVAGFQLGAETANKRAMAQVMPVLAPGSRFASAVDGAVSLVLGCVGLGIVLLAKDTGSS